MKKFKLNKQRRRFMVAIHKDNNDIKTKILHLENILIKLGITPWDAGHYASKVIRNSKQEELNHLLWN